MSFLTNTNLRNEIESLSELGFSYIAFNSGHVCGFRNKETPYLALGRYRTKSNYTGEQIELPERLMIDSYMLIHLKEKECQMRLF